jgi:hypothetical protein
MPDWNSAKQNAAGPREPTPGSGREFVVCFHFGFPITNHKSQIKNFIPRLFGFDPDYDC